LENLQWGFLENFNSSDPGINSADRDPFLVGPKGQGNLHIKSKNPPNPKSTVSIIERMIASNMTQTIDNNTILAAIIDKKNTQAVVAGRKGAIDSIFNANTSG
jgi:hypothetical protein